MPNSQPTSRQLRSLQRRLKEAVEGGREISPSQAHRFVSLIGECARAVEQMELAAGIAPISQQLKAAGSNVVMLRAVLRQAGGRRHGQ